MKDISGQSLLLVSYKGHLRYCRGQRNKEMLIHLLLALTGIVVVAARSSISDEQRAGITRY
jgi:hypothetical protein